MAKMFAAWVAAHGVSVEHSPDRFERRGVGVTSSVAGTGTGGGAVVGNYFHVAIPTPVLVEDRRATLTSVHYLFDARGGARLTEVHVFDGVTEIFTRTGLRVQGNHAGGLDADNGVVVRRDGIAWGIGLTLKFEADRAQASTADVFFTSFGGDFHHNI